MAKKAKKKAAPKDIKVCAVKLGKRGGKATAAKKRAKKATKKKK